MSSLSGLTLRLPSGAKGGELRIEVSSAWKNPSGFDPGANVTIAGIPVARSEGKRSARVDILDVLPHLETVELAPGVRVKIPVVTFNIASGAFDPVDLGAQARRVVHTKLVGTTFF